MYRLARVGPQLPVRPNRFAYTTPPNRERHRDGTGNTQSERRPQSLAMTMKRVKFMISLHDLLVDYYDTLGTDSLRNRTRGCWARIEHLEPCKWWRVMYTDFKIVGNTNFGHGGTKLREEIFKLTDPIFIL